MRDAFEVAWRTLRHFEYRSYIYIWANLCCLVLSLPLITAPAAWAGLMRMSYVAHTAQVVGINDFWQGFKENLGRGVILAIVNAAIIALNLLIFSVYQSEPGILVGLLLLFWLLVLFIWFSIQLYLWTIYYEMETPTLVGAVRNAAVIIYLNPLFTLSLWLLIIPTAIFSFIIPILWMVVTASLFAVLGTAAVLDRLAKAGYRPAVRGYPVTDTHTPSNNR